MAKKRNLKNIQYGGVLVSEINTTGVSAIVHPGGVDKARTPERKFIEAADELYSAVCEAINCGKFTDRLRACRFEFADACNAWGEHPGKLEDAAMRASRNTR